MSAVCGPHFCGTSRLRSRADSHSLTQLPGQAGAIRCRATVAQSHRDAVEEAGKAIESIATVLEGESDALMQCGFAYQEQEQANADDINNCMPRTRPC